MSDYLKPELSSVFCWKLTCFHSICCYDVSVGRLIRLESTELRGVREQLLSEQRTFSLQVALFLTSPKLHQRAEFRLPNVTSSQSESEFLNPDDPTTVMVDVGDGLSGGNVDSL